MRLKLLMTTITILMSIGNIYAQKTITGTVTDDKGSPLAGVTVIAIGSSSGTITDFNGNFSITVSESVDKLKFSFVDMGTKEVSITGTKINVELSPKNKHVRKLNKNTVYHDMINVFKQIKPVDKSYTNTDLPNNEYEGRLSKLVSFRLKPYFQQLRYGYHKNSFLNPIYGDNKKQGVINNEFGTYIGADFGITFITPLSFGITHFKSKYSYIDNQTTSDLYYKGWEFSFSKNLGITQLPLLKRIIANDYFGIGYHTGKVEMKEPFYEQPEDIKNRTNTFFWKIGVKTYPFAWINRTYWFNQRSRDIISSIGFSIERKQSLISNRKDAYNAWALGLTYRPEINNLRNIRLPDLTDLPGSDGEYADYIKSRTYFSYGYINTDFKNEDIKNDTTISKKWGHNIAFKYSFFYPLMIDFSGFTSRSEKISGTDSIPIAHNGFEFGATYGITSAFVLAVPYLGAAYQFSKIKNRDVLFKNIATHEESISGLVWKLGVISHFNTWILITEYKHSAFKEDLKFSQFTIKAAFNLGF